VYFLITLLRIILNDPIYSRWHALIRAQWQTGSYGCWETSMYHKTKRLDLNKKERLEM